MRVLPAHLAPVTDRDSTPWWEALADHRFVLQRCSACRAWRWPPRAMCGRCGSFDWAWEEASGRGTLVSWVVNHHSFDPSLPVPYMVVAVAAAEQDDVVLLGGLASPAADGADGVGAAADLWVGQPMEAVFSDVEVEGKGPLTLLDWRPGTGA